MNALGMVEVNSIPKGIEAGDAMLKAAGVSLVSAQAVCAGKYTVIVAGNVAEVKSSVESGKESAAETLVDSMVIANVDPQVIKALSACTEPDKYDALGIIETFSLAAAIVCADHAVKAADIGLIEVRLGRGLGGKSFVTLTGGVAATHFAVETAKGAQETQGMIARAVVIPSPHPDILKAIL